MKCRSQQEPFLRPFADLTAIPCLNLVIRAAFIHKNQDNFYHQSCQKPIKWLIAILDEVSRETINQLTAYFGVWLTAYTIPLRRAGGGRPRKDTKVFCSVKRFLSSMKKAGDEAASLY